MCACLGLTRHPHLPEIPGAIDLAVDAGGEARCFGIVEISDRAQLHGGGLEPRVDLGVDGAVDRLPHVAAHGSGAMATHQHDRISAERDGERGAELGVADEQIAFGIEQLKGLKVLDGGDAKTMGIGIITQARWKATYDYMVGAGLLKPEVDWKQGFTDRFVKDLKLLM